jgi:transposase
MGSRATRYDEEFKAGAVRLVAEKGCSLSQTAEDLGVSVESVRRWVDDSRPRSDQASELERLQEENKGLKKALADSQETVEVLKKSVRIFVRA